MRTRTVLAALGFGCLLFAGMLALNSEQQATKEGPLMIRLETYREQYVRGEPIRVYVTWENIGATPVALAYGMTQFDSPASKIIAEGPTQSDCHGLRETGTWEILAHQVIEPGASNKRSFEAYDYGIGAEGDYFLSLVYQGDALSEDWVKVNALRQRVTSNRLPITIVKPTGIDALAFEKYADQCGRIWLSVETGEKITKEFPSSIYAGWHLVGTTGPLFPNSTEFEVLKPVDLTKYPEWARKDQEQTSRGMQTYARQQADLYGRYLRQRPDFTGADWMKYRMAYWMAQAGQYSESRKELEQLISDKKSSDWVRARSEALLHFLSKERLN